MRSEAFADARNRLLRLLAESIDGVRQPFDIVRLLEETPIEESLLLVRTTISELLTVFIVCHQTPPTAILNLVIQSLERVPQNPMVDSKNADHAAALLLKALGFDHPALHRVETLPLQRPPGWLELSLWAADRAALSVPSVQTQVHEIVSQSQLELARGAVFAAIRECTSVVIRILRWLPWCDLSSPSGRAMKKLFTDLHRHSHQKNMPNFHLSVIHALLRSSN